MSNSALDKRQKIGRPERPTIGLLSYGWGDSASRDLWTGVSAAARELELNLITFPGENLEHARGLLSEVNVLYEMVSAERLDGLVVWGGVFAHRAGVEEVQSFFERYQPLPMINLSLPLSGIPTLLFDSYQGMYAVVEHLIVEHDCRRIAFVRGPEGHPEAEARYRAYQEALSAQGLVFDPDLVQPGSFDFGVGNVAVQNLLAQGAEFEALVAVNDQVAMDAQQYLRAQGLRVPADVAVVGFDNRPETHFASPPLTTVEQSWSALGQRAVELLAELLQGAALPERIVIPPRVVIRESCGCVARSVRQAGLTPRSATQSAGSELQDELLDAMRAVMGDNSPDLLPGWPEKLLESFLKSLAEDTTTIFRQTLLDLLARTPTVAMLRKWQEILTLIRHNLFPSLQEEERRRAENSWQQARVLIGEHLYRRQASLQFMREREEERFNQVAQRLFNASNLLGLLDTLVRELSELNIRRCYLSLYEQPDDPKIGSRLMLAYDEAGRRALPAAGQPFATPLLVPEGMLPARYQLVLLPLHFQREQLGLVLLEIQSSQVGLQQRLQSYLSGALRNVLSLQRLERRAARIQIASEVAGAVSTILDRDRLIQRIVDLIQERFELYYVGLFLVERRGERFGERKRWAILRAGTGEAGQEMLSRGHRLEVGEDSMIGWSVAHQEARIALDVGQESVRFDNPLLPATRSEMALPLLSRGQTIGALTIQSTEEAAFSAEDIRILQTMATQVAIAIENASLFKEAQNALREMRATQRRYVQQSWQQQLEKEIRSSYTATRSGEPEQTSVDWQSILDSLPREQVATTIIKDADSSKSLLSAPLTIRDAIIGNLILADEDGERRWSEEEQELVSAVASSMGQVAERLRLLDETQQKAAQEQLVGEIMTPARETLDVKSILQTATDDLYRLLELEEVVIKLVEDI